MTDSLLMIFVKNPVLGKCKTRLAKTIGDKNALNVYLKLLEHTKSITQPIVNDKVVYYSDYVDNNDIWDNKAYLKTIQSSGGLGEKMQNAFDLAFLEEYKKVIIIGSDCFELTTEIINQAFEKLTNHDAVIGPAKDGGYYLLGIKNTNHSILKNKTWSTNAVFQETVADFKKSELSYFVLPQLSDIDIEEDLIGELRAYLK